MKRIKAGAGAASAFIFYSGGSLDRIEEKVLDFIRNEIDLEGKDRILAGVSGGSDSVALFLILYAIKERLGVKLSVVHVEHGIRGEESLRDASFTEKLCQSYRVPCHVIHVDVPSYAEKTGMSEEEAARVLRYRALRQVKSEYEKAGEETFIAVAHHISDNAETILLQMIRGTGLKGMEGLKARNGDIIRPLLCLEKDEILSYLREKKISYCEDSTNHDLNIQRNRLRHDILPVLRELNPKALSHIKAAGDRIREADSYIEKKASEFLLENSGEIACDQIDDISDKTEAAFPVKWISTKLLDQDSFMRRQILLVFLRSTESRGKDISARQIEELEGLFSKGDGKRIDLSGYKAVKNKDRIELWRDLPEKYSFAEEIDMDRLERGEEIEVRSRNALVDFSLVKNQNLDLSGKNDKFISLDGIKSLELRTRKEGDYFVADEKGHVQKLRRYFINEKISREEREKMLFLSDSEHILCVIGGRIGYDVRVNPKSEKVLKIRIRRKENE